MKTIYKIKYGSRAYGTMTPDSDIDIRGILLPSMEEALSLKPLKDEQHKKRASKCCHAVVFTVQPEDDGDPNWQCSQCSRKCDLLDVDEVMFPIQKFFKLVLDNNPSVLEWLFVPNDCILEMSKEGKVVRDGRLLFLSKELIYQKFKGYAYSEFTRLTKLTGKTGDKRKQVVLDKGYNTKSAMNIIRLLDQATELLSTASLTMPLRNNIELKQIKSGKLSYQEVLKRYDEKKLELDEAYRVSKLPEKARWDDANALMISIIKGQ